MQRRAIEEHSAESLDAVVLWHVLEHLEDPGAALRRVRGWLRPGGLVLVGVPNAASWQARIAGPGWLHWDAPRHRVHFTPRGVNALLARSGFEQVRTEHMVWEHNPASMWMALLTRMGMTPAFPFHALKRNIEMRPKDVALTTLGLPLIPPAIALEAMAAGLSKRWNPQRGGAPEARGLRPRYNASNRATYASLPCLSRARASSSSPSPWRARRIGPERRQARGERVAVARATHRPSPSSSGSPPIGGGHHRHALRHRLERGVGRELVVARRHEHRRGAGEQLAHLGGLHAAEELHVGARRDLLEPRPVGPVARDPQRDARAAWRPRSRCRSPSPATAAR